VTSEPRPRIGVSACLLGRNVRFDGGHKKHDFVHETLSQCVEFVPVCPELESGMTVPRESLRLVTGPSGLSLIGNKTGDDSTQRMTDFAKARVEALAAADLDGFVLKKDSPSCGVTRVKVYAQGETGPPDKSGVGLFTKQLRDRLPVLPLTEEGWLTDPGLRECFLDRVYTHHRMRTTLLTSPSRGALTTFHSAHKLLYMAHSPARYRTLGRLVAGMAERPLDVTLRDYAASEMVALGERATPGKQANVLQHIMGYFKDVLTPFEKQELLVLIDDFRAGAHGFVGPFTLLVHYLHKHNVSDWLDSQVYFQPYPKVLGSR
jgi:uncharacterized protein YbgA (DUF1722 family)/uncharacterized protein YbbK (DUF523 family)